MKGTEEIRALSSILRNTRSINMCSKHHKKAKSLLAKKNDFLLNWFENFVFPSTNDWQKAEKNNNSKLRHSGHKHKLSTFLQHPLLLAGIAFSDSREKKKEEKNHNNRTFQPKSPKHFLLRYPSDDHLAVVIRRGILTGGNSPHRLGPPLLNTGSCAVESPRAPGVIQPI